MISDFYIFEASFLFDELFTRPAYYRLAASLLSKRLPHCSGFSRWSRHQASRSLERRSCLDHHIPGIQGFLKSSEINDRALYADMSISGCITEEIQEGMTETYAVDIIGLHRFLYSDDGVKSWRIKPAPASLTGRWSPPLC